LLSCLSKYKVQPYDATQTTTRYCLGIIAYSILFSTAPNMKVGGGRSYMRDFGALRWENERDKESVSVMDGWIHIAEWRAGGR